MPFVLISACGWRFLPLQALIKVIIPGDSDNAAPEMRYLRGLLSLRSGGYGLPSHMALTTVLFFNEALLYPKEMLRIPLGLRTFRP